MAARWGIKREKLFEYAYIGAYVSLYGKLPADMEDTGVYDLMVSNAEDDQYKYMFVEMLKDLDAIKALKGEKQENGNSKGTKKRD